MLFWTYESLAQSVEQQPFKLWVAGSIPARLTILCPHRLARPRTSPFHGENRGSNPLGDASLRCYAASSGYRPGRFFVSKVNFVHSKRRLSEEVLNENEERRRTGPNQLYVSAYPAVSGVVLT